VEFDVSQYPDLGSPLSARVRQDIDRITGTSNREAMILGRKSGGALVFVIQSRGEDRVLDYMFDSVRDAAKRQLSGKRAGIVLVGFEGISADELVQTASQDNIGGERPTALRVEVSRFLGGSSAEHVVGVGFLSRDELISKGEDIVSSGGSVYHFPKTDSRLWHEDFRGLFRETE
jgi:hypothetical protein